MADEPVAGVVPDATDPQHPEWWYTAWYVDDGGSIRAMHAIDQRPDEDPYIFVADADRMLPLEVAEVVVAWWNETHAAPGAPLVGDAGEVGAFLGAAGGAGGTDGEDG